MKPTKEQLFNAFKSTYSTKYRFSQHEPIGDGAYGYVYKAADIYRAVDVAIKIFIQGRPPQGSARAWSITSRIIDSQIAATFTIEEFRFEESQYVAAVSRFIPGRTLKEIFTWMDSKLVEDRILISEDLAKTLVPSLLDILARCHNLGYGHGDLHEGNIMSFLSDIGPLFTFRCVLIDFDNASIKTDVHAATEKEKQLSDVRLFRSRLGPNITMEWKWGPHLAPIYLHYESFEHLRIAYTTVLAFIATIENITISLDSILNQLKPLVLYAQTGFSPKPTIDAIRTIAAAAGHTSIFTQAYANLLEHIKNPNSWIDSADIIAIDDRKNRLYRELFG